MLKSSRSTRGLLAFLQRLSRSIRKKALFFLNFGGGQRLQLLAAMDGARLFFYPRD
jgi:hypothetical protein